MVSNLLFTEPQPVAVSPTGNFIIPSGEEMNNDDVPVVRYRFDNYGPENIAYINTMLTLFPKSLHVAEISLEFMSDGLRYNLEVYRDWIQALVNLKHVAKFIRVPIQNSDVAVERLSSEKFSILSTLFTTPSLLVNEVPTPISAVVDRVALVDHSTTLHMIAAYRIRLATASQLQLSDKQISICNSPLAQDSSMACLTANTARELGAIYGTSDEMVIATNALEGRNASSTSCCMCLKHIEITSMIRAGSTKTRQKSAEEVEKAPKPSKKPSNDFMNLPEMVDESAEVQDKSSEVKLKVPKREPAKKKPKLPKGAIFRY